MLPVAFVAALLPMLPALADPAKETSPVPFPHPLITEILYSPPKGEAGDANGDGKRSATGDEFIELVNPHDKPINLKGYILTDAKPTKGPGANTPAPKKGKKNQPGGQPGGGSGGAPTDAGGSPSDGGTPAGGGKSRGGDRSRLRFEFPELTLKPDEVVVVFNGYEGSPAGPCGDSSRAGARNENFDNAYVFTMRIDTQFAALSNTNDCVLLLAPDASGVQCVEWSDKESGDANEKRPEKPAAKMEKAPNTTGSVQRSTLAGSFVSHRSLGGDYASEDYSPGRFGPKKEPAKDGGKAEGEAKQK